MYTKRYLIKDSTGEYIVVAADKVTWRPPGTSLRFEREGRPVALFTTFLHFRELTNASDSQPRIPDAKS